MKRMKQYHRGEKITRGFTLIVLLVVLAIIGFLAGVVAPKVMQYIAKAQKTSTRAQIKVFHLAAQNYKIDTGQYPESLEDLVEEPGDVTGWNRGGYLDGTSVIPLDAWDNEYEYLYPGDYTDFDIISWGADGQEGGEDEDADIYNSDVRGVSGDASE